MLAKKLKAKIGEDKKLLIHIPDLPHGEVEVIILRKEEGRITRNEILSKGGRVRGQVYTFDSIESTTGKIGHG